MAEKTDGALTPPESSLESDNRSASAVTAELLQRYTGDGADDTSDNSDKSDTTVEAAETDDVAAEETEAPEAAQEAETEGAEDEQQADPEDQPAEDDLSQLPKHVQAQVNKRIGKLTARAKTAEEQFAKLKEESAAKDAKLAQLQQATTTPPIVVQDNTDPTSTLASEDEIRKARDKAKSVVNWAEDQLEEPGDEVEFEGKVYTKKEVRRIMRDARADLEERLPAREKWLEEHRHAIKTAAPVFPWVSDPSSAEYKEVAGWLKQRPHIARDPAAVPLMAWASFGIREYQKAQQAKKAAEEKKPAAKPAAQKPPPVDAEPRVAPPRKPVNRSSETASERAKVASSNASSADIQQLLLKHELAKTRKP